MLKVFSVRDVKADSYSALVVLPTVGLAKRGLVDAILKGGPMAQYPEDYMLYEIGEFDDSIGLLIGHRAPVFVMSAIEAVAEIRAQQAKNQPTLPGIDKGLDKSSEVAQ